MHQVIIRAFPDDAVELRPKVADHADVFDHHVVHQPLPADLVEPVVDRKMLVLGRQEEARGDFGEVPVDGFLVVQELDRIQVFPGLPVERLAVRLLDQAHEDVGELRALGLGPVAPMHAQGAAGDLALVDQRPHDGADPPDPCCAPVRAAVLRRLEDRHDAVDRRADGVQGRVRGTGRRQQDGRDEDRAAENRGERAEGHGSARQRSTASRMTCSRRWR